MKWTENIEGTPASLRCWVHEGIIKTKMTFGEEASVHLISDNPKKDEPLESHPFDFALIWTVLSDLDTYYI
ncbi:MAG: hypothetical protein LBV43_04735 [Prevotella sp.]|jgi:hypothetical protein|nr:hypothetical protein [Prevotella sp.]